MYKYMTHGVWILYQLYLLKQGAGYVVASELGHFVDANVLHEVGLVIERGLVVNLVQRLVDQGQGVGALLHVHNIVTLNDSNSRKVVRTH